MLAQTVPAATAFGGVVLLLVILHVAAGGVAILAGAAALSVRKGERRHRAFGTTFFGAMVVMCTLATLLSALRQPGTIVGGPLTLYLVLTARTTVTRPAGRIGRAEWIAFALGAACAAAELTLAAFALASPRGRLWGYPAALYLVFGVVVALAALGDLRVILRGGIAGAARIARHVWRMCVALFMATGSFFLGQQKVMPAFLHGSPLLVALGLAPLALMVFWLVRVRATRVDRGSEARSAPMPSALRFSDR